MPKLTQSVINYACRRIDDLVRARRVELFKDVPEQHTNPFELPSSEKVSLIRSGVAKLKVNPRATGDLIAQFDYPVSEQHAAWTAAYIAARKQANEQFDVYSFHAMRLIDRFHCEPDIDLVQEIHDFENLDVSSLT